MQITRRSPLTRKDHTMEIDVTQAEIDSGERGTLAQHAMPRATPEQREFIMTGYTPEDWAKIFPPEGDE